MALAYSSAEATFLHLDVEPTQIVDVLGMCGRFTFVVCQEEWS